MSIEFQRLMDKIAAAIEKRTIVTTAKKTKLYEAGAYSPQFSLADRGGELICIWSGNLKKPNKKGEGGDIEITRIYRNIEKGFVASEDDPECWNAITLKVMHHFKMKL